MGCFLIQASIWTLFKYLKPNDTCPGDSDKWGLIAKFIRNGV